MALTSWKIFSFFDISRVKCPGSNEDTSIFGDLSLNCICTGSDNLFVGSNDGTVHIFSSEFKKVKSWQAYETGAVTQLRQLNSSSLLVTISEDLSNEPILKVWALDKPDKKSGAPGCLSITNIQNGRKQFPISAFAILKDLSQLALGFANGAVTLVRGDLINDRGTKQRTVFESEDPITGVEFRGGATTSLYLSTTAKILTLIISGKSQGQPAKVLEDSGCGVGCMTYDPSNGDIVVARDDAIQYYGLHGRGPSYAMEGAKQLVQIHRDYVAVAAPPESGSRDGHRSYYTANQNASTVSKFAIFDTDLRFIAHTESLQSPVQFMFAEWGDLFLLTNDGKLFRYHEKSLSQKLDILFQRELYVLAINLAQKAGADTKTRNMILRRYGDHLHKKGDFDTAMQQYLKAINSTEPSQVIRKFLDSQRINNLIEYLEELHDHSKATIDHTTLLLNCYAKLKDNDKLESFIKSDRTFDIETAIQMCRQGGYLQQAVYLAEKSHDHQLVIDILVEEMQNYALALDYIHTQSAAVAQPIFMKYSRVLLEHCPSEMTQLFVEFYTGQYVPRSPETVAEPVTQKTKTESTASHLASYIPLPYRQMAKNGPPTTEEKEDSVLESHSEGVGVKTYEIPSPRTAFAAFADHPEQFVVFLQACLDRPSLFQDDKVAIYTALFELYLEIASGKKENEREKWQKRATDLLEQEDISIDASNVLLLSHLSNFEEGTIMVREQQGLRFDIFRSYTSANDTRGAINALNKYGTLEPQLYPAALTYFTSSPQILKEAGDELDRVLQKINDDGLMAPLQVIQTLCVNDVANMGLLKSYLSKIIEKERKEISSNHRLIDNHRKETEAKLQEIKDLDSKSTVFQARRCAACGRSLDLPTVHYLCKHSFHRGCLNEVEGQESDCPKCAPMNNSIRAFRKAQESTAERHDMFQEALKESRNKFLTISEFFGRGVMGPINPQ